MAILTTGDLPAAMTLAPAPEVRPRTITPITVLRCEHGIACPPCVLAEARRIVANDTSLTE